MPGPVLGLAIAEGLKLGSNLLAARSAKKRREKLIAARLQALQPLQQRVNQASFAESQSEGTVLQALTTRTLQNLAGRGVLHGSGAPGEVASAIAPVVANRESRLDDLATRLAAAQANVYEGETPGYGDAFAQTLGSTGSILAYLAGRKMTGAGGGGGGKESGVQTDYNPNLREMDPSQFGDGEDLASAFMGRAKKKKGGTALG